MSEMEQTTEDSMNRKKHTIPTVVIGLALAAAAVVPVTPSRSRAEEPKVSALEARVRELESRMAKVEGRLAEHDRHNAAHMGHMGQTKPGGPPDQPMGQPPMGQMPPAGSMPPQSGSQPGMPAGGMSDM